MYGDEDDEMPTGDGVFSPDAASIDLEMLHLRGERRFRDADALRKQIAADVAEAKRRLETV